MSGAGPARPGSAAGRTDPTGAHGSASPDDGDDGADRRVPVFDELWQAEVFAMVDALLDAERLTPAAWTDALATAIRRAQAGGDPDLGDTAFEHWLAALEALCVEHGAVTSAEIDTHVEAWRDAYLCTPHGRPVVLPELDAPALAPTPTPAPEPSPMAERTATPPASTSSAAELTER